MLFIGDKNLAEIAETAKPNDTRPLTDFSVRQDKRFVNAYTYDLPYFRLCRDIRTNFYTNSSELRPAAKGYAPTLTLRYSLTGPSETFLTKMKDKRVLITSEQITETDTIADDDPRVIKVLGTAYEDLNLLIIEMVGGGGGGNGGNFVTTGAGGSAGGYYLVVFYLPRNPVIRLHAGKGGVGTKGTTFNSEGLGGDTYISDRYNVVPYILTAKGGECATGTNIATTKSNESDSDWNAYTILENRGGQSGNDANDVTLDKFTTVVAPNQSIERGGYTSKDSIGGAGGNSYLGQGGTGAAAYSAGGNGGIGAGGGGACLSPYNISGAGGPGQINIYY